MLIRVIFEIKKYQVDYKLPESIITCLRRVSIIFSLIFLGPAAFSQQRVSYLDMGQYELSNGHFTKAIEDLNVAVKILPDLYESYFYRGLAKYELDDFIGAEKDYTKAISINPYWAELF